MIEVNPNWRYASMILAMRSYAMKLREQAAAAKKARG